MKTSELIGPALDWAVAKCENALKNIDHFTGYGGVFSASFEHAPESGLYSPSSDWAQGGPIIEREYISTIDCDGYDFWRAEKMNAKAQVVTTYGPTPLVAAMRTFVASKLGYEIEIPEELK